jgi:nitrogen fixation/metabolism regulation signal transduction histidine kinase
MRAIFDAGSRSRCWCFSARHGRFIVAAAGDCPSVSRPIQQLTAALTDYAGGNWSRRLGTGSSPGAPPRDEVGRAIDAFNHMADQLEESRERLVHLTQMASWQSLARKTAHELKNSLTPIRLTVEEIRARELALGERVSERVEDRAFMDQPSRLS